MKDIPKPILIMAWLSILPFYIALFAPGDFILTYGRVALAFTSGALYAFNNRDENHIFDHIISVLPALWAVFLGFETTLLAMGIGMTLAVDYLFHARKIAPAWWMHLRVPTSVAAILALLIHG